MIVNTSVYRSARAALPNYSPEWWSVPEVKRVARPIPLRPARRRRIAWCGCAADIAGEGFALGVDGFESLLHLVRRGVLVQVAQHQDGRLQQRGGVGDVFAGNVGGRAVHRLEDGAIDAEVGAGNQAQAAHQAAQRSLTMSP